MSEWVFAFGVLALWIGGAWTLTWWLHRRFVRTPLQRMMEQMRRSMRAQASVIAYALTPAIKQVVVAFKEFAEAYEKDQATIDTPPEQVDEWAFRIRGEA